MINGNTRHPLVPRPYPSKLSLVMPMYNEESVIPLLLQEVGEFLRQISTEGEIILVNDGRREYHQMCGRTHSSTAAWTSYLAALFQFRDISRRTLPLREKHRRYFARCFLSIKLLSLQTRKPALHFSSKARQESVGAGMKPIFR